MRLGEVRPELERTTAGDISLVEVLLSCVAVHVEKRAAVGEAGIGKSVFRVNLDRPPEHLPGVLQAATAPLVDELSSTQVVLVRLDIHRAVPLDCLLLSLAEYHTERVEDRLRDLILNREHVFHVAIEFFRPQLVSIGDVDQLRADAKPVPDFAHATLENGGHLELSSNLADVFVLSLEGKRRRARRNAKRLNLRESVDQLLRHAIGEVFILGIRAHVGERKYSHGFGGRDYRLGHGSRLTWRGEHLAAKRLGEKGGSRKAIGGYGGHRFCHRPLYVFGNASTHGAKCLWRFCESLR